MVQKTVPVWYNRSCLRFGIYSENLDDELLNRPRFQNKRLRYCVGAGMVLVTTLLVGLMIYNMFNGYGLPSREKDALQHLLMLRMNATAPTPLNKTTIASTFATTTNTISSSYTPTPGVTETTTDVTESTLLTTSLPNDTLNSNITFLDSALMEVNFVNLSANTSGALPYRYVRKDIKIGNRRHGKQRSSRPYDNVAVNNKSHILPVTFKENNPQEVSNNYKYPIYWVPPEVALQSEIQSRIMNQAPRPFKVQNVSVERPANNRIKMVDSDNIPFYEFGSVNKYPQLAAYRYPNEAKNIQDIIKYLTAEEDSSRSPSNKQHNTQVFRAPSGNNRKIKFAGVYKTAEKENSLQSYNDPEESMNEFTLSDHHTQMHDSSLNAHAYAADPFQAFKPSDPSEINLLANSDFRFSPINNRVRITSSRPNGHRWKYYEANPNDKYFPRPPINFRIPPSSAQSNNQQPLVQVYPGTYTTATFKPFGKDPVISSSPTSSKNPKKVKPFSVMLDIYPMMDDTAPQATVHKARPHPRPGHGLGHVRFPPTEQVKRPDQVADNSDSKHQMVVHLNLYPKKKNNHNFSNRNDVVHTFHVDVQDNPYCCDQETLEKYAKYFSRDMENEDDKRENKIRKYTEDGDEELEEKLLETQDGKSWNSNMKEPRRIISNDRNAITDMSEKSPTLLDTSVFQIGSPKHLTSHWFHENNYEALDAKLPSTSITGVSGNDDFTSFTSKSKVNSGNVPLIEQGGEYFLTDEK